MRIGRRKALAVGLGVVAIGFAFAGWYLGGTDALLAVVLAAVVVGAALVVYVVVQVERRLRSGLYPAISPNLEAFAERTREELKADMKEDMREAMLRMEQTLSHEVDRKLQRPGEQAEALLRAINAGYTRMELEQARRSKEAHARMELEQARRFEALDQTVRRVDRTMNRQFKHSPAEVDALLQVHRRTELGDPLPLMGGWALSPRGMLQAIDLVTQPHVSLVVECGSGTSTLFLARALELKGSGRLIALEHLVEYLERTEQALQQHGLSEIAEVRLAPLEKIDIDGMEYMWYAVSSIADLNSIDVLLVDGPPGGTGDWARYPAYPLLRERLSTGAVIAFDDARRSDEKAIVDAWRDLGGLSQLASSSNDQAILRKDS